MKLSRSVLYLLVAVTAGCFFTACTKMNANYDKYLAGGEHLYSKKPDSVQAFPGHNRVLLSWLLVEAPRVTHCRIYWNGGADSLTVPVTPASGTDSLSVVIDNLAEGIYTFDIYSYDASNNASIVESINGQIYGDTYIGNLINRDIQNASLTAELPRIAWASEPDTTALGQQLRYTDPGGVVHTQWIPLDESVTRLPVRPLGDTVQYRTAFKPSSASIDTFYAAYQTVPLPEASPVQLDKGKFQEYKLPTDAGIYGADYPMTKLWDDNPNDWYETAKNSGHPHWFTFDMGVTASLDHYLWQQRGDKTSLYYANASPSQWAIYGSNDPNPNGDFDSTWVLLGTFTSVKPSGEPVGTNTDEDIATAQAGETYRFPHPTIPVRYLRIKILETWAPANDDHAFISELTLYGVAE